jgi:predicted CopG family antitoxin
METCERRPMKRSEPSRIRDQRVDVKVGPEVYRDLKKVKDLLEEVKARPFSMSEVIMLLCQWSKRSIAELRETQAKISELTTKKTPPSKTYE